MLRNSTLAAIAVTALTLSGCQSLCDRFLNKGHASAPAPIATSTYSTGSTYGYQPAATGYSAPTTVSHGTTSTYSTGSTYSGHSTYTGSSTAACPDGSYLTGDGSCRIYDDSFGSSSSLGTSSYTSSSSAYTTPLSGSSSVVSSGYSSASSSYTTPLRSSYSSSYSPASYSSSSHSTSTYSGSTGITFYDKPSVKARFGTCPQGYEILDDNSCLYMGEFFTPNPNLTN